MADDEGWVQTHPVTDADLLDNGNSNPFEEGSNAGSNGNRNPSNFDLEGLISDDTIQGKIAREVYGRGKEKAQGIVNLYANIDFVRPFFDVEPKEVASRLAYSVIPLGKVEIDEEPTLGDDEDQKKPDLYGPLMLCFTLSAILLLGLKLQHSSDTIASKMEEGTLLSTALFVCFTYWIVSSVIYAFLTFMFNGSVTFLRLVSISGYAQFGVCISLLVHCFISGWLDLIAMVIFGGLSAITLGLTFFKIIPLKRHGILLACIAFAMQVCYLLYLKIFYAAIAKVEVDSVWW